MTHINSPAIIDLLRTRLLAARKQRDQLATEALQSVIAAIDNAGAVQAAADVNVVGVGSTEMPRREQSDHDIREIIKKEILEMQHAIKEYQDINNTVVDSLHKKSAILEALLE